MSQYLAAVWKCRYFWLSLVQMDLRTRYRRSFIGLGWSLLQPIAMTAVLCTVFATLFSQNIREYAPSLLVGLCFWNFITACTIQGCLSLFHGEKYIRQHPAPVAIYPLRTMLGASFHFLVALAVVVLLRIGLQGLSGILSLVSLLPTVLLLFVLGWSLAVLAGFSNSYFPDMHHLSEVGLQIVFYGTPIIHPPEMLRTKGLGWIVDFNPLAVFVEMFRAPLLTGSFPALTQFAVAGSFTLAMLGLATLILVRLQRRIIFQL